MSLGGVPDLVVTCVVDLLPELLSGIPDDGCDRSFEVREGLLRRIVAGLALLSGMALVSRRT